MAIGDLDGDGRLDLAVSIANGVSPRVIVFRQSTAHGFAASDTLPVAYNPFPIGLVDTTRDGRLDIVVGHDDAFSVLRQSNGSFGPEDFYVAPRSSFATWASMAIGPRNAQGAALIAFNGQLFAPRTAMATGQVKSATRLARPYWRPLTQR